MPSNTDLLFQNNWNVHCLEKDIIKLSRIFRKEYLIQNIIELIKEIYSKGEDVDF